MKKIYSILLISVAAITLGTISTAQNITYDFDEVEVLYAAEFFAKPVNISPDAWIVQIAGGTDKPIKVLYGVVNLKKNGEVQFLEEFIRVEGEAEFERFLVNSVTYDYYEGTDSYKEINSFFWSAKKLVDSSVVKDFTPPIKSIALYRNFNEDKKLVKVALSFSNEGEKASQEFWSGPSLENLYEADLDSLNEAGDPTVTTSK